MLESPAFLGVARSATGRRWLGPGAEVERRALGLAQRTGLPEILARVLAARGVGADDAEAYLAPTLRALMPDPSALRDMDAAADRLARAARAGERVALFGDYDVDGAASIAVLARWLRGQGVEATIYVPDRVAEGYGPNEPAMRALAAAHDLVVCLDCGSLGHGPVAAARAAGADVLIVDHHLCEPDLPPACAVVNPNRQDETAGLGHLCAAGVAFLLVVAANRALRRAGVAVADPMPLLEFVALATVADVAPLVGLNRAFVRQGLKALARRATPGLRALADAARLAGPPASFHLGYVLGPRINAGGRIGACDLGARLLSTDDPAEAECIAATLEALNAERRAVEAAVLEAALAQAEARGADGPLVWAAGEGWRPGVVGIVAARLKERFDRPAVVVALDGDVGRGSGRSVAGVDLGSAVATLAREGLVAKGGGHRMAAGLTLARDAVEPAMARLGALLARQGAGAGGPADLRLDGALAPAGATVELAELLEGAGPWGAAAPAPRFVAPSLSLERVSPLGPRVVRVEARDGSGRIEAASFAGADGPLAAFLRERVGGLVHLAGRLAVDDWGGRRRARLMLDDAAPGG